MFEKRQTLSFVPIEPIPKSNTIAIAANSIFFIFLTWIAVSLRFATRSFIVRTLGSDDWLMLWTLIVYTAFQIVVLIIVFMVKDLTFMTGHQMTVATNLLLASETLYVWCMIFLKMSLGVFYLRILVSRWQRATVYIVVGISALFNFAYFWFVTFQCGVPRNGSLFWENKISGKCASSGWILGFGYSQSGVSFLTDVWLAALPIPMLIKAKIPTRERWVVGGILTLAAIGSVASIVRIPWVPDFDNNTTSFWKEIKYITIWSAVEPGLGITAASCATLRPLLRRFSSRLNSNITPLETTIYINEDKSKMSSQSTTSKSRSNSRPPSIPLFGFMRDGRKPMSFLLSRSSVRSRPASTFFLDTVDSVDTMHEQMNQTRVDRISEELQPHPFTPHSDVQSESDRASKRATWWPLPRESIVMDKALEDNTDH